MIRFGQDTTETIENIYEEKYTSMKEDLIKPEDEKTPGTEKELDSKYEYYKYEYHVSGMHCPACELVIEKKVEKLKIIKNVNAVLSDKKVYLETDTGVSADELLVEVNDLIKPLGYQISLARIKHKVNFKELAIGFGIAAAVVGIFFLIQKLGIANILGGKSTSLALVFLIGVVASLSSCMAIVGGLVLSISSSYAKGKDRIWPLI